MDINIVEPYAKLLFVTDRVAGVDLLRKIEWFGRISHRSEDAQTPDSWERFIQAVVVGKGDWSIVEHAVVSVDMLVDRGITHEIVRHRLLSITQESTRFVNYEKKMPPSFIKPTGLTTVEHEVWWRNSIETAGRMYRDIVRSGVPPQIARSVFPNALASRLTFTCNLRNLRHLFLMRTTKEAHPQMRQVMIPLLEEAKQKIPILFDDIEPESRQIDNLRKPR